MVGVKGKGYRIFDEYTFRDDLSNQQKFNLRHPEKRREYINRHEKKKWAAMSFEQRAEYHYKKKYKLTYDQVVDKLDRQNYLCPCCNGELDTVGPHRAVVDHCHNTGQVRDMLCNHCNKVLGLIKEQPKTLEGMLRYLEKWSG